jgi:hypothetical protein
LDIAKGEATEKELDAMISRRHDQRVQTEGEGARDQLWVESVRRSHKSRQANRLLAWCDYEPVQRHRDACLEVGEDAA